MCCNCCSVNQRKAWVYGIGTLLIALGTALLLFWSGVAETLVHNVSRKLLKFHLIFVICFVIFFCINFLIPNFFVTGFNLTTR